MQSAFVNPPVGTYELGPTEVLDYAIDFTALLATGETIAGTPTISQSGGDGNLSINPGGRQTTVSGNVVTWWVGSPTVAISYNVHAAVVTSQSRTFSRYIQISGVNR